MKFWFFGLIIFLVSFGFRGGCWYGAGHLNNTFARVVVSWQREEGGGGVVAGCWVQTKPNQTERIGKKEVVSMYEWRSMLASVGVWHGYFIFVRQIPLTLNLN